MGPLLSKFNSHIIFRDYYKSSKHPSQKAAFLPGPVPLFSMEESGGLAARAEALNTRHALTPERRVQEAGCKPLAQAPLWVQLAEAHRKQSSRLLNCL